MAVLESEAAEIVAVVPQEKDPQMRVLLINNYISGVMDQAGIFEAIEGVGGVELPRAVRSLAKALMDGGCQVMFYAKNAPLDLASFGRIDRVVAVDEASLELAGEIRSQLGICGMGEEESLRFRDKVTMKSFARKAGIRTPEYTDSSLEEELEKLAMRLGYKVFFKPRSGYGSFGIYRITSKEEFRSAVEEVKARGELDAYEMEEYVQGNILHVDGVIQNGRIQYSIPSRYIGATPFELRNGGSSGSITLDRTDARYAAIQQFTKGCLNAFELRNSAFHLEIIEEPNGNLCFLELGARAGGEYISDNMHDVFGFDTIADHARLQIDKDPLGKHADAPHPAEHAGAFVFPAPPGVYFKVNRIARLSGKIPGIIEETNIELGRVYHKSTLTPDRTPHIGVFRVAADSVEEVERIITEIRKHFSYEATVYKSNGEEEVVNY